MKRLALCAAIAAMLTVSSSSPAVAQQPNVLNPVGSYSVTTSTDTGEPLTGTMVIAASANGYTGTFTSALLPDAIPVLSVTTNGRQLMATLNIGTGLALVWIEFADDGTFKGTWHELSAGFAATGKKNKG